MTPRAAARPADSGQVEHARSRLPLADFEPILADRMKRVIALDRPQLLAADENGFAAALAYHDRDLEEELAVIETTRRQMARILRALPESAAERVGVHSERGPKTLIELLTTADRSHCRITCRSSPKSGRRWA